MAPQVFVVEAEKPDFNSWFSINSTSRTTRFENTPLGEKDQAPSHVRQANHGRSRPTQLDPLSKNALACLRIPIAEPQTTQCSVIPSPHELLKASFFITRSADSSCTSCTWNEMNTPSTMTTNSRPYLKASSFRNDGLLWCYGSKVGVGTKEGTPKSTS